MNDFFKRCFAQDHIEKVVGAGHSHFIEHMIEKLTGQPFLQGHIENGEGVRFTLQIKGGKFVIMPRQDGSDYELVNLHPDRQDPTDKPDVEEPSGGEEPRNETRYPAPTVRR